MHAPLDAVAPSNDAPYLTDDEFALECNGARAEVARWWPVMIAIESAAHKESTRAALASAHGIGNGTLRGWYYKWLNSGRDWATLIDRSKFPHPREHTVPHAFREWVLKIHEGTQRDRSGRETRRVVLEKLSQWERHPHDPARAIPGYEVPPPRSSFTGVPDGWSELNFRRFASPNAYARTLRKVGPKAASEYLPNVYTTRVGLAVAQVIYFDDQWHDTYVNLTGRNDRALRPQSFNALDALTGFAFEPGLKPQVWDEEKSKRVELNQLDFFWYVMSVLTTHGYNADAGTVLVFEHGTANVDKRDRSKIEDHFDDLIHSVTGGKVRVDRSGLWRAPAFKEMLFEGKSTGNFRFKAPIESWFNLLRNRSAALPGATGRNPEWAPEESHGLLAENSRLLKLADELPRDRFLALRREILEWEDYCRAHRMIVQTINRRRDHALEGWRKLGFTGMRYRLAPDQPWIPETQWQAIPEAHRELYRHIVTQPGHFDGYQLSPEEAFDSQRATLTRLPMAKVPLLAPERAWEPVKVTDNLELRIKREEVDSEPLRYYATARTPQGHTVHLDRGRTYLRLLNIFDPSQLWLAEAHGSRKGAFIGVAPQIQPACKIDADGVHAQLGAVAHMRSAESKAVEVRAESKMASRLATREHNRQVIDGDLPMDREERERLRSVAASAADFLPVTEPAPDPTC